MCTKISEQGWNPYLTPWSRFTWSCVPVFHTLVPKDWLVTRTRRERRREGPPSPHSIRTASGSHFIPRRARPLTTMFIIESLHTHTYTKKQESTSGSYDNVSRLFARDEIGRRCQVLVLRHDDTTAGYDQRSPVTAGTLHRVVSLAILGKVNRRLIG